MFTREQIEELKPYEEYFCTATVANYVRNIPGDRIEKIKQIWTAASGEIIRERMTCGVCQLNFLKKVGKQYYKDKEHYEREMRNELASQSESVDQALAKITETKPKKRNAKKKETGK